MEEPRPGASFTYFVAIDGAPPFWFSGVEGLAAESEVYEFQEGGENSKIHRMRGRMKFPNVKLTRTVDAASEELGAWFFGFKDKVKPGTLEITAFSGESSIVTYELGGVHPIKWTGPAFESGKNAVAKEVYELVYTSMKVKKGPTPPPRVI